MRGQGLTRQDTPDASFPYLPQPLVRGLTHPIQEGRQRLRPADRSGAAPWQRPGRLRLTRKLLGRRRVGSNRFDPAHQGRVGRGPPGRRRGTRWLARPHRQWPRGRRRLGVRLFNAPGGFGCGFSSLRIFFSCSSRATASEIARGCAALTSQRIHDGPGVCLPGVGVLALRMVSAKNSMKRVGCRAAAHQTTSEGSAS
jgi:hypothetical protein